MEIILAAIAAAVIVGYIAKRVMYPSPAFPPALPVLTRRQIKASEQALDVTSNVVITNVRWPNL